MSKECFVTKNFRAPSLALINLCNEILEDYARQGFDLTLRQLYYQLVSRDLVPNTQKSYSNIGQLISNARLAGLVDWSHIVDRGRATLANNHWDSPGQIVRAAANSFRIDKWADQPIHIEVMIEKQALEGVLAPTCSKLDVSFTSNKGYSSQSFMKAKGESLSYEDKPLFILYLGDHDPSGLDMDRDIKERLELFSGCDITFQRLALTREQIEQYDPPPNPAKITDTRAGAYIMRHGRKSWELDALPPEILCKLVEDAVLALRDDEAWEDSCDTEEGMRARLLTWADEYK